MITDTAKANATPGGDKSKPAGHRPAPLKSAEPARPDNPAPPAVLPPLFRRADWLTFALTAILVFTGYFLTMSPNLTLEDSGELATGSFYAGVPHPPGYPLWTLFTWLFTVLVPVSNIAYRVSLASAVSGSLAAAFLALITSRGSSMLMESIPDLKDIPKRLENTICMVAGFVAGMLLAYNGYMWSQSIIVEVYPFSVLSLMGVVGCLLRWIYAPHQRRFLYFAWLLFGVCFTNHQTLIVAAMGIEVAILAAQPKLGRDLLLGNSVVFLIGAVVLNTKMLGTFEPNGMVKTIFYIVGISSIIGCGWLTVQTRRIGTEIFPVLGMFGLWLVGASIYFWMPLSSMSNPPMNWGYPRTVEGFIHALSRGQYEKTNPTDFFNDPLRLVMQLSLYFEGAKEEFNIVNLVLALVPFFFLFRMQKRERAWIIGLTAIWSCLAILLMILLNPTPDRATRDLIRVFFTSSYAILAILIGYGITLIAAYMATHYQRFRMWGLLGGGVATLLALYSLAATTQTFFGDVPNKSGVQLFFYAIGRVWAKDQYGLPIIAGLLLLALGFAYLLLILTARNKAPMSIALGLFALLPVHSIMSHWSDNEQRGHMFGFWFGHDMFTPPFGLYPEMTKDAVLFGGTDPGRFCPTYMIFCESFIPPQKREDPKFDRRDVYIITQNALADGTYLEYIRAQYNRSTQIDPPFFQELLRPHSEVEKDYTTNFLAKLAYSCLDKPFLTLGKNIENRRRAQGVYPPKEIYTPTIPDSQQCFSDYLADAQRRVEHDQRFPNEPRQIKPGEDVHIIDNRVQVSGQVAVMSINGLLTKVIFDHNPTNEFFVEESFPLDWMYPYLTPFGIIMKINRQQVPEFTEDIVKRDHLFWTQYSDRLVGNWVTYDTTVKDIADFVEKVYLQRDFSGFKGDRKFIRDDTAQKAFSKLRSSIGGIYNWRISAAKSPAERARMVREAEFAYRQAFAFCPYSPEAVFRYVQLLASPEVNRIDDAILVARTCLKLDKYNSSIDGLLKNLLDIKAHLVNGQIPAPAAPPNFAELEKAVADNPTNFAGAFQLASSYFQTAQSEKAMAVLDRILANPQVDVQAVSTVAQFYNDKQMYSKLELALERLTQLNPGFPEAWYDLAFLKLSFGKTNESLTSLQKAISASNQRLTATPTASNLLLSARQDNRFAALRSNPSFKELVGK